MEVEIIDEQLEKEMFKIIQCAEISMNVTLSSDEIKKEGKWFDKYSKGRVK